MIRFKKRIGSVFREGVKGLSRFEKISLTLMMANNLLVTLTLIL